MAISPRELVVALCFTCATQAASQSFASQLNGTWQGTYCGGSSTTFRFNTLTPQRTWVTERWCNAFDCGDLDYAIIQIHPASRVFTVRALAGTGWSTGGYDIYFEVSADGRSMTGTYMGHRCSDNQLTKVSSDPGAGPVFAASVAPLPRPAPATPRAGTTPGTTGRIPSGVATSPLADEQGSTACLLYGSESVSQEIVNGYGHLKAIVTHSETRWVYNKCARAVSYSMKLPNWFLASRSTPRRTIAPGSTHVWNCPYEWGENAFGTIISQLVDCSLSSNR